MGLSDNMDRYSKTSFFFFFKECGLSQNLRFLSHGECHNCEYTNMFSKHPVGLTPTTLPGPRLHLNPKVTTVAGYPAGSQEGVGEGLGGPTSAVLRFGGTLRVHHSTGQTEAADAACPHRKGALFSALFSLACNLFRF